MARYYFHLRDGTDILLDPEGVELADIEAVRKKALESARDTLSNEMKDGQLNLRYRIDVEDVEGAVVHSLPLAQAFQVIEALNVRGRASLPARAPSPNRPHHVCPPLPALDLLADPDRRRGGVRDFSIWRPDIAAPDGPQGTLCCSAAQQRSRLFSGGELDRAARHGRRPLPLAADRSSGPHRREANLWQTGSGAGSSGP